MAAALRQCSLNIACRHSLSVDEAEDVAQDTLLRLWQLRADIEVGRAMAFALTVARHLSVDVLRRRRTQSINGMSFAAGQASRPDQQLESADNDRWLEGKLKSMPSTEYMILKLRQVEGRTNKEIAAVLGISESSVPTILSRARRPLFEALQHRK